jgi:asparagine synthase (glutamine-hydrolysing)
MCGIACYLGGNKDTRSAFSTNSKALLKHRGPDDNGIYYDDDVALIHTRLSILELTELGHQPMPSSCGRYVIIFNGEIYNHLELRKRFLSAHNFRGHSDTETIIELFRTKKETMLLEMIGMWALIIWDKDEKKMFVSRSRLGQKPLYVRRFQNCWTLASEVRPLLQANEHPACDPTALVEYIALGNYGHLGVHTFFKDVKLFPEGSYAWLTHNQAEFNAIPFWTLPDIKPKDKIPFDKKVQNELHDIVVEAVLSVTLSDVPIGLTLSGGVDSSIIAGILASYYDKEIHIFTAQSRKSKFDETRYVDAVIHKYPNSNFIVHRNNLQELSIKESLEKYIKIQEEPFGDPSIIAHGFLMEMASKAGIKVILNGQGADEMFFGYNNMAQAILAQQFKSFQLKKFSQNIDALNLGSGYLLRTFLKSFFPGFEINLRTKSRINRRSIIQPKLLGNVDNKLISLYKYNNIYDVWRESIFGVHIPHLVHYDDMNGMANSVEGRMPFLDHRIAEYVSRIKPEYFLEKGMRKYILRESCKQYLPDIIYNRKDKIGFFTPLISALENDTAWVSDSLKDNFLIRQESMNVLLDKLKSRKLKINEALQIWRCISVNTWMKEFNISKYF